MAVIGVAQAASVAEEARTVTWLRFIILASMILNALVLILPGALIVGEWLINTYSDTGVDADAAELVFGVGSFGYGMLNLVAVMTTFQRQGRMRSCAIALGYALSILMVPAGMAAAGMYERSSLPLLYIVTGFVLLAAIITMHAPIRKEGACLYCGHDLAGLPTGLCPACGELFEGDECSPHMDFDADVESIGEKGE